LEKFNGKIAQGIKLVFNYLGDFLKNNVILKSPKTQTKNGSLMEKKYLNL